MIEEYLIAILSGIGSGGAGALIGTLVQRKKTAEAEHKAQEMQRAVVQFGKQAKEDDEVYGFVIDKASTNVAARFFKKWEGLRIVKDNFCLPEVPAKIIADGTIRQKPIIKSVEPNSHRVQQVVQEKAEGNLTKYSIPISPPWTKQDGSLSFVVEAVIEKAFRMKKSEVEQAYQSDKFKLEYYSSEVRFPTKDLEISVKFPHDFKVCHDFGVFFGPGETQHQLERDRRAGCLSFNDLQNRVTLRIQCLPIGFRYFISWMPEI